MAMSVSDFFKSRVESVQSRIVWKFLRLNIAKKLFMGYIPLTLLIFLIAAVSLSSIEKLHGINKRILNTNIIIIDAAESMVDALLAQELFARRYMVIHTPEMLELYFERRNDFDSLLDQLAAIEDVSYINTDEIDKTHNEYNILLNNEFNVQENGQVDLEELSAQIAQKQEQLIAMIQEVSESARADQNSWTRTATALGDTAFKTMVALCIIGTVLALSAAVLIFRNISRSILLLREATDEVANGHFDNLPTITNYDELGDLSRAFGEMAKRLKHLEEMYIDASPLTLLPGGVAIENVLKKRIETTLPLSFCMLDLDNFKALNDHHGYATGNDIIKTSAHVIDEAVKKFGNDDDFVGHIGGDDFVVMTTPDKHTGICKYITENFDGRMKEFYTAEEVKLGYITGHTRQGDKAKFPLVTISIAVVTNMCHTLESHIQVGEIAAELKEYAKSIKGNVYVVDKRRARDKDTEDTAKDATPC